MGDESSLMMVMMSRRLINCHCSSYLFAFCLSYAVSKSITWAINEVHPEDGLMLREP